MLPQKSCSVVSAVFCWLQERDTSKPKVKGKELDHTSPPEEYQRIFDLFFFFKLPHFVTSAITKVNLIDCLPFTDVLWGLLPECYKQSWKSKSTNPIPPLDLLSKKPYDAPI